MKSLLIPTLLMLVACSAFYEGSQAYGWFEGSIMAAMPLGGLLGWLWDRLSSSSKTQGQTQSG